MHDRPGMASRALSPTGRPLIRPPGRPAARAAARDSSWAVRTTGASRRALPG